MGAWHLGQRLEETSEVFMTPVPEELITWGYRKSDPTRARTEHGPLLKGLSSRDDVR